MGDGPMRHPIRSSEEKKTQSGGASSVRRAQVEPLEPRKLLSGSNAIDELDFGNPSSEAVHNFEPGYTASEMPIAGVGALSQTYREPCGNSSGSEGGSDALTFTLATDPTRQNYLTIRVWGSDIPGGEMYLLNAPSTYTAIENSGGNPQFPNRFLYYTIPIPVAWTTGQTSTQMTIWFALYYDAYGGTGTHYLPQGALTQPVYSVYTTTDPDFQPDSSARTGTEPTQTTTPLSTLTGATVDSILEANRKSLYGSGGYLSQVEAEQAIVLNGSGGWSSPAGAPEEVAGLDLFTNVASWMTSNPSATSDQWRNQIADTQAGPGYTAFPDELISALTTAYTTAPYVNSSGQTVAGLDDYHDSTLITRIVAAMDGSSYEQDSDGGFIQQGSSAAANSAWTGLTSTARTSGSYSSSTAREPTVHGGGDLQGIDTYTLGWSIITLLNDATAAPILKIYLAGSYDANLNGGSVLRATAYERMLYNAVNWYSYGTGGTESQNMFQMVAMYAMNVALEKLQTLYPNSAYVVNPANYPSENWLNSTSTPLQAAEMVMGLIPDTLRGVYQAGYTNYGMSTAGLGEAGGVLSGGQGGDGYGEMLPWISTRIAALSESDPGASASIVSAFQTKARAAIDAYDQFVYPQENATINSSGAVTSDVLTLAPEPFITYRNVGNPNSNAASLNVDPQYIAADSSLGINDAYALRSTYLQTQYGQTPTTSENDSDSLMYTKDLSSYESALRSLINVNPASLTALPGEGGNYTWADMQIGAVAFDNNGERFFMAMNWRNGSFNGGNYSETGNVARLEDITSTTDHAAFIQMPVNSATVQSDGNLSGTYGQAWVVRYGNYLVVVNQGTSAYTATFPKGTGLVENLVGNSFYSMGTSASVAAGTYAIFWLNAPSTSGAVGNGGVDIGTVGVAGSNSYSSGTYTLSGGGAGLAGSTDALHFVSVTGTASQTLTAHVLSQTSTTNVAQAGIMVRGGTGVSVAFAAVARIAGGGVRFIIRSATGGTVSWTAVPTPLSNVYVKLTNSGSNVAGYYSTDGVNWTQIGSTVPIAISSPMYGLTVSSGTTTATSTATFANVVLIAGVAPTIATSATATVSSTTANLSVLGADAGGESGLTYTWSLVGTPPDPVSFSVNGTNAAKNTIATFATAGTYTFLCQVTNASGATTTSTVQVIVAQIPTSVSVVPMQTLLSDGQTTSTSFTVNDQFGQQLKTASVASWSIASGGIGSVDQNGVYTTPSSGSGTASVRATVGNLIGSATLTIQAPVGAFTATQDVGSPAITGSASYSGGVYTVSGAGSDIWNTSDQFRYVYVPLTGDGTITAQVIGQTDTAAYAKAGVMFRNTLDANSAYTIAYLSPSNGVRFEGRSSQGASSTSSGGITVLTAPTYVRLTRAGNAFSAYESTDGSTWTQVGSARTIGMNSTIYVGLVVSAVNASELGTVTFANVSITTPGHLFQTIETIGAPVVASTYSDNVPADTATMTAESSDIWDASDQFEYAYTAVTNNATLVAHVASQTNTGSWAKAGLMFRKSDAADAAFVDLLATPGHGVSLQWRTTDSENLDPTTNYVNGASTVIAPVWLELVRSGSTFTGYYSTSTTVPTTQAGWTKVAAETVTMGATADVGLAMTSNNTSQMGTATFAGMTLTGTANAAPTVATAASASSTTVTGKTVNLSVVGADSDGGASNLTYTWGFLDQPPAPVTFGANGTTAAASATATFSTAGTYVFQVLITDSGGLSVSSNVTVVVNQTLTSETVAPASPELGPATTQQFSAVALDQFGNSMATQPAFTWSLASGSGSINSGTGLYTATASTSSATVKATTGFVSGTDSLTVTNQVPLIVTSSGIAAVLIDASEDSLSAPIVDDNAAGMTYAWSAVGAPPAPVTFGAAAASTTATFTKTGSYILQVTATDSGGLSTTSTVNVSVQLPAWLSSTSVAVWNPTTQILTVTGATSIIADPGGDEPIIQASGSAAVITLNPAGGTDIHIGGLSLTNGASATVTSLGSARSVSNYHLLVIGVAGATVAPTYTIDSASTLDLMDNDMAILYGSGSSSLTTVNAELLEAYDGGVWNKPGLTSSIAATEGGKTALGFGEASTLGLSSFDGLTLGGNAVLVKYTITGDANLDGSVGLADYNACLANYNGTGQPWTSDSFDYSGTVGLADYNTILADYNQTLADFLPSTSTPAVIPKTVVTSTATTVASTIAASSASGNKSRSPSVPSSKPRRPR
jgi:regulation of enolase protein 1 (concanavalin A-like superfamily)